ncbi:MAG: HAD family hydrolase [Erysipelotrichia bacterium]|nr:HAD family hydrolase [Erysipelotrichia bacterium]
MIKLFVTDIDNTLYSSELKIIPEENILALKRLIKKGVKICLASSRVYSGCTQLAQQLNLQENGGYIIALGGSFVVRCKDNKVLVNRYLDSQQVKQMYLLAQKMDIGFNVVQDKYNITTKYSNIINYDFENVGMDCIVAHDVFRYVKEPVYKLSFSKDEGDINAFLKVLRNNYADDFYFSIPQDYTVDVGLKNINKLTGIQAVISDLGINLNEVAAIGDNGNDIPMLEAAGISGCVANGSDEAKKAAGYVVGSCSDSGVAQFIKERVLDD